MLTRRHVIAGLTAAPLLAFAPTRSAAATARFYNNDGIAIDGTDAVAYFTQSAPVAGDAAIFHDWSGVRWQFASTANRDAFAANPEAYAPQYGGFCAWAVAQGYTASTTPEAWAVVDDKLYLNYSRRIQRRWARDIPGNIALGDQNWPTIEIG